MGDIYLLEVAKPRQRMWSPRVSLAKPLFRGILEPISYPSLFLRAAPVEIFGRRNSIKLGEKLGLWFWFSKRNFSSFSPSFELTHPLYTEAENNCVLKSYEAISSRFSPIFLSVIGPVKLRCFLVFAWFAALLEGLSLRDPFLDDLPTLSLKLGNFGLLDS